MIRLGSVASTVMFSSVDGPGNRFVVFMQGCNFDCIACHNPQTIPAFLYGAERRRYHRSVTGLVHEMRRAAPFLSGITVSGGEATLQAPFVRDLFMTVRNDPELRGLTCFIDSNGSCDDATWDLLEPVTDGAMIDLKCWDDDIHRTMTGQSNAPVLASIRRLHSSGKLYEVRLLLVAGVNDDPGLLRRTAEWLAAVDPAMRVKLIGFRSHGVRPHDPPLVEPDADSLTQAATLLADVAPFNLCVV